MTYVERLAPLDVFMPRTYIRVLLVFESSTPQTTITQRLQDGLNKLSVQVPWLPGRVFSKAPAEDSACRSLEIRWNDTDTPILVDKGTIATSYKHASSRRMPAEAIPSHVWPAPGMIDDRLHAAGAPVFATSIFRFADEGVGLCVCLHHNAVDGSGLSAIIRLWARNVADPTFTFASSSRSRVERLSEALAFDLQETASLSSEALFKRHPEYSSSPPALPEEFPPYTSKLFTISMHWIDTLKQILRKHTSNAPTTNTVICALIWTTITQARMQSNPSLGAAPSRLAMAVNGRPRISETFSGPETPFFGNAVLYSLAQFPGAALASACHEAPARLLAHICEHIARSQAPAAINARSIAEAYCLMERAAENGRPLFVGWDVFGSRDLTISNWADLGLYEMDFGALLGRPGFVRLPLGEEAADGVAVVMPRQRAVAKEEVLEVVVMLRRDQMDAVERDPMWEVLCRDR